MVKLKAVIKGQLRSLLCKVFPEIKLIYTYNNSTELLQSSFADLKDEHRLIREDIEAAMNYIDLQDPSFLKDFDKKNLPGIFKARLGYDLNLDNPKTFNEKLQWLKINVRKPEMTIMADKYRVRDYLKQRGYGKYLNQLYGVYSNIEEIKKDWGNLPDKFVLKVNHWSGGNIIIKDKSVFDFCELEKLDTLLHQNYYYKYRCGEWPYKDIQPCIIAEKYLQDETGSLLDYKFFCFNNKAKYVQLQCKPEQCFYNNEWIMMEFFYDPINFTQSKKHYSKPDNLCEMIALAEELSKGYIYLRVDLYNIRGSIVFGEFTFTPGSGTNVFSPALWDKRLGELINLY